MTVVARASPSLALTKYWGKMPSGTNIPSTSSLAVTLGALHSQSTISDSSDERSEREDTVTIDGVGQDIDSFRTVINAFRSRAESPRAVIIDSSNDFPTAAGLASSSSGFAAMAVGLDAFFGTRLSEAELSAIARLGSGSACRAIFGGFTVWPAGADHAEPLADSDHWPQLRVIAVVLQSGPKAVSSRSGMENARLTSPYYSAWTETSESLYRAARSAVLSRDLEKLGYAMGQSYLRMFSTMFTSEPPLIYWLPESLAVIQHCQDLRSRGVAVWETMDAGPQVKLVTVDSEVPGVVAGVREILPDATLIVSEVGGRPTILSAEPSQGGPQSTAQGGTGSAPGARP